MNENFHTFKECPRPFHFKRKDIMKNKTKRSPLQINHYEHQWALNSVEGFLKITRGWPAKNIKIDPEFMIELERSLESLRARVRISKKLGEIRISARERL